MSINFLKLTTFYNEALEYFYDKYYNTNNLTYSQHLALLLEQDYGISNFFEKNLIRNNIEAQIIVLNDKYLQKKWCAENNYQKSKTDIVLLQIDKIKPTVLFVEDVNYLSYSLLKEIKNRNFIKLIIGQICCPYNQQIVQKLKLFDIVLTCSPKFSDEFNAYGIKNYMMYHAFEKTILSKLPKIEKINDVFFAGSFIPGVDFHADRRDFIIKLIENGIQLNLFTAIPEAPCCIKKAVKYSLSKTISFFPGFDALKQRFQFKTDEFYKKIKPFTQNKVFGIDMFNELANSKIGLNIHGGVAGDYAANMRLFEVTGVGTCLVTDDKKNMSDLFEPDYECVVYKSLSEAYEKIKWLLNNPEKCKDIALAGQKRCFNEHSYENRTLQLIDIINRNIRN